MIVSQPHRIQSLDLLRGLAVLGILLMNVNSFALPLSAYMNPTAYGSFSGIHELTWLFQHVVAELKFITLFSLLFGAGIVLFSERAQVCGLDPKHLHYRRMGWLLVFGLAHGWLLWYGDILFTYAVAGMLVFTLRNRSTSTLALVAIVFYLLPFLLSRLVAISFDVTDPQLTESLLRLWQPDEAHLTAEIAAMTGSLSDQFQWRAELTWMMQTETLLFDSLWTVSALMLFGMLLYRWGVLTAMRSQRFYRCMALLILPGSVLTLVGVWSQYQHGFDWQQSIFVDHYWNYFGSVPTTLGYIGLAILWMRSGWLRRLGQRVRSVGRMAFSCYIMQTAIAVLLFNVLGLFGQLDRFELLGGVIAVWLIQLYFAPWYLQRYAQGPLERLWRTLTYRSRRLGLNGECK